MSILRGINERLITRPSYFDSLLDGLQFISYPSPGVLFDLAKNRNIDENKSAPRFGYAADGTPGVQATGLTELWSFGSTSDLRLSDSGVGNGTNFAVWLWTYIKTVSSNNTNFCDFFGVYNYVDESNNQGWKFVKGPHAFGSDGTPRMIFQCFKNNGGTSYSITDTTVALAAGSVHQYVMNMAFDPAGIGGGTRDLYRDGSLRTSPVGNGYRAPTAAGLSIECFQSSPSNDFLILGFGCWNRKLTAGEITALNNYPELLLAAPNAASGGQVQILFRPTAAGATAKTRRTLGELGTRIGSRQMR